MRLEQSRSSIQAGYRITFSTEVNDVGKVVKRLGDVGRLIEVGTPIGITRRNQTKSIVIRLYNCGFQYQRVLKTERYDDKRVVPKSSLTIVYQDMSHEVILKY